MTATEQDPLDRPPLGQIADQLRASDPVVNALLGPGTQYRLVVVDGALGETVEIYSGQPLDDDVASHLLGALGFTAKREAETAAIVGVIVEGLLDSNPPTHAAPQALIDAIGQARTAEPVQLGSLSDVLPYAASLGPGALIGRAVIAGALEGIVEVSRILSFRTDPEDAETALIGLNELLVVCLDWDPMFRLVAVANTGWEER